MLKRLPTMVVLVGVLALFMATWGARLERCPGAEPTWRLLAATERTGCDYHAWWRVQAGNLGVMSEVDRPKARRRDNGYEWARRTALKASTAGVAETRRTALAPPLASSRGSPSGVRRLRAGIA